MIWLVFAHFIGDWGLRTDWMAQNKGKYWSIMFAHCMIWTACICIMMRWIGLPVYYWHWIYLVIVHWICDSWKCKYAKKFPSWHLYVDQAVHLFQLAVVSYYP